MSVNVEDIVKKEEIENHFTVGEVLGRGKFATVKHITEKITGKFYAAKYLRKRNYAVNCRNTILQEAELLMELMDHRAIVDVKEVFEGNLFMIIILELCTGGDLFHSISADPFSERESVFVLKQVIDALTFLHKKFIIHLDIKPENILLINETKLDIKLADFGLAVKLSPIEEFKRIIGTPEYVAPEVINFEPLSTASDMWSLGALTYALLCGYSPFLPEDDDSTDEEVSRMCEQADILSNVSQAKYDFDDEVFEGVSENAKEFIRNLLVLNPKRRPDADQCLRHQWLKTYNDTSLIQHHSTHSPVQSSTSSGFSDLSDISTNLSNMSAEYKAQMRYISATPDNQAESRILEVNETEINEQVTAGCNPVSCIKRVDTNLKNDVRSETAADALTQETKRNKPTQVVPSPKVDKIESSAKTDREDAISLATVTSPKEEQKESKYQYRPYSRKSPFIENNEKPTLKGIDSNDKSTLSVHEQADREQKQDHDALTTSNERKKITKASKRRYERSDTNMLFGKHGVPFSKPDYLSRGNDVEQSRTSDERSNSILEESITLESSTKTIKTPERETANTRSLLQESRLKRCNGYNRFNTSSPHEHLKSPTSNKLEVPRTSRSTRHSGTYEPSYRTTNLINYFNYNTEPSTPSTTTYTTSKPISPLANKPYTPTSPHTERPFLQKQDSLKSYGSDRSISPRLSNRRSSTPTREAMPPISVQLAITDSVDHRTLLNSQSSSNIGQNRSGISRTQSYMELSKNDSRSYDNLKDLVRENAGGNTSRSTSPVPTHTYSPLSISSQTIPRSKKSSTSSDKEPRISAGTNPEMLQKPFSGNKLYKSLSYAESFPDLDKDSSSQRNQITPDTAYDLISATRRIRFPGLDIEKVQNSIRAYGEHFHEETGNCQYNHNNNSNQLYTSTADPLTSIDSSYSRSNRSVNSSMENIAEQHAPYESVSAYPSKTLDRIRGRKRILSNKDYNPMEKRDLFMSRSTSLHSLHDGVYSPATTKSSKYVPAVNSPYYTRRSKESSPPVLPYISIYRQNRTTHHKAQDLSN